MTSWDAVVVEKEPIHPFILRGWCHGLGCVSVLP